MLADVGYESPSPIQAATIPPLLAGPRRARPGADRHRQDRRVRAADPRAPRSVADEAAGAGARADARARDPGRRSVPALRDRTCPASTCCRSTAARATGRSSAACKRGVHVVVGTPGRVIDHLERGSLDLSQLTTPRARRSRRDAAHGFHRRCRDGAEEDAADAADRAVLGDDAGADPAHRADLPARSGRDHDQVDRRHRGQHPPALLVGQRPAQARRADAHPRSRTVRRRCSCSRAPS